MPEGFVFEGIDAFNRAMDDWNKKVLTVTRVAVSDAAHTVQRGMQTNIIGRHKPGTPTAAVPGGPPMSISGDLRRSIRVGPIVPSGKGWATEIGPTMIYGRRVELGYGGSNAYPYATPGFVQALPAIGVIFRQAWTRGMR